MPPHFPSEPLDPLEPLSYNRLASALCNCLIRSTAVDTVAAPIRLPGMNRQYHWGSPQRVFNHAVAISAIALTCPLSHLSRIPILLMGWFLSFPFYTSPDLRQRSTFAIIHRYFLFPLISLSTSTLFSLFTTRYFRFADSYVAFGHRTPSDC